MVRFSWMIVRLCILLPAANHDVSALSFQMPILMFRMLCMFKIIVSFIEPGQVL